MLWQLPPVYVATAVSAVPAEVPPPQPWKPLAQVVLGTHLSQGVLSARVSKGMCPKVRSFSVKRLTLGAIDLVIHIRETDKSYLLK